MEKDLWPGCTASSHAQPLGAPHAVADGEGGCWSLATFCWETLKGGGGKGHDPGFRSTVPCVTGIQCGNMAKGSPTLAGARELMCMVCVRACLLCRVTCVNSCMACAIILGTHVCVSGGSSCGPHTPPQSSRCPPQGPALAVSCPPWHRPDQPQMAWGLCQGCGVFGVACLPAGTQG